MTTSTNHALKEWAVEVDALNAGTTIMLLRKGGIREEGKHFRVAHDEVVLYPTYEHQVPELLKPAYAPLVQPVAAGWHPPTIPITTYARITDILQVSAAATVERLLPYHIWNERFAAERFGWKPRHPLFVLLLRAYRLPRTHHLPYVAGYGGCRSWIDLEQAVPVDGLVPTIGDEPYNRLVAQIRAVVDANESVLHEAQKTLITYK
ncbi:MAG: DUF1802 family protein [Herpetosiphon sp.]